MKTLVTVSAFFAFSIFIWNAAILVMVAVYGRKLHTLRENGKKLTPEGFATFAKHKKCIKWFLITLVAMVVFIEIPKIVSGEHWPDSAMFAWHIRFVFAFIAMLALMLIFTGVRTPLWHGVLAVVTLHFYVFMASTGLPLMYQSIMKYHS